jgi:hypothetical protein
VLIGSVLNLSSMGVRLFLPMMWRGEFGDRDMYAIITLGTRAVNLAGSALYLNAIFTGRKGRDSFEPKAYDDDWDLS